MSAGKLWCSMSMTTELAQRMKAAALKAKHAGEAPVMHFDERISALNEFQLTACPANVVDLVEALEDKDKRNTELEDLLEAEIKSWMQRYDSANNRREAAEKRIAELEARTFKVEMPEAFYPDGDTEVPYVLQEDEVIAAIVAAGGTPIAICRLCKSELNLSHRPDGSHYCHSSSAGVAVEGE